MSRIYLNALGINNAVGTNTAEVFQSIFIKAKAHPESYSLISGRKTQVHRVNANLPALSTSLNAYESRNNRLLLQAVQQIESQLQQFERGRLGIILGTSTSGIQETEKAFQKSPELLDPSQFHYYKQEISNASDFLAGYLDVQGLRCTISTACTSSAKAFIEAKRWIEADLCDAILVGGVDTLSSLTLDGFDSLDSVSSELTNPFSRHRNGINIGEGAAVFILSRSPGPVELLGYGESSDAFHISSPDPEGVGAEIALRQALQSAKLKPQDVGYVNLHGTGTIKNDIMESHVTHRIFGSEIPMSSTKPLIGHTLGAAGAQEAALCYLALSEMNSSGLLPKHLWDGVRDPDLADLRFVTATDRLGEKVCMSNSFAFGGNNVSLIFGGVK